MNGPIRNWTWVRAHFPHLSVAWPCRQDWLSRQRLIMAVIVLNISLAVLFIKLLT